VDCALEEGEPGDGTMTDDFLFLVYGHHGRGRFAWRHSLFLFLYIPRDTEHGLHTTGAVEWGSRL
jgi:hypothetical protein